VKFIRKAVSWATHARTCWVTPLSHEIGDYAVKYRPVIKALAGKKNKIIYRDWSFVRKKLDRNITFIGG
jgi:hypothetical protein